MDIVDPGTPTRDLRDGPAEVPMPATEGRRYTFLTALGYDKLHAARVAVGHDPAPADLASRYHRSAAAPGVRQA